MSEPGPAEKFFLKVALKNGLLSRQQIQTLLQQSRVTGRGVAELALRDGLLGKEHIDRIQRAVVGSRVARIDQLYAQTLQHQGLVTPQYLARALEIQKQRSYEVRLGELLVSAGLISMESHTMALKNVLDRLTQGNQPNTRHLHAPAPAAMAAKNKPSPFGSRPEAASRGIGGRPSGATRAQPVLELKGDSAKKVALEQVRAQSQQHAPGFERQTRLDEGHSSARPGEETKSVERSRGSDSSLIETQKSFLQSAMEIELEDENDEVALIEHDQAILEDDMKLAESMSRSGINSFGKIDEIKLSTTLGSTKSEGFKADVYFRKRRQSEFKKQAMAGLVALIVFTLVTAVLLAWNHSSSFESLKVRVSTARRSRNDVAAYNELGAIKRDFDALRRFGVSTEEATQFESLLSALILQSKVRSLIEEKKLGEAEDALNEGRVQRRMDLEIGRKAESLGLTPKLIQELENEIGFSKSWRAAQYFESNRRLSQALKNYQHAQIFAKVEDDRPERRIKLIQSRLFDRVNQLRNRAKTGDSVAVSVWQDARKEYYQLFQKIPGKSLVVINRDGESKRLIGDAREQIAENRFQQALEFYLEARSLSPNTELDHQIAILRRKIRCKRSLAEAKRFIELKAYESAYSLLLRVRGDLQLQSDRDIVDNMIKVCQNAPP
jgi:hypothetical protein